MMDDRFWWEGTSEYWELPFYSDFGLDVMPDFDDMLAGREQLWALRELDCESGEDIAAPILTQE